MFKRFQKNPKSESLDKAETSIKKVSPAKKLFGVIFHPVIRMVVEAIVFLGLIGVVYMGSIKELPVSNQMQFFTILSGSMEPTIHTGAIVLVNKAKQPFEKGDVITFMTPRTKQLTTHRVINKQYDETSKKTLYSTKGDANGDPDQWILTDENIVGKVKFSIPFLGYLINFAKTPQGFFVLAVVPGLVIILDEVWKVKRIIQLEYENKIVRLKKELEEVRETARKSA